MRPARRLFAAATSAVVAATLLGTLPATATPAPAPAPAAGQGRPELRVADRSPGDHDQRRFNADDPTPSPEQLYRRADLPLPGKPTAVRATAAASGTAPSGSSRVPGLARHVAPSCTGTGTDGNRVQVLYVREADQPSRLAEYRALLRDEVATVDDVFAASAKKTGSGRRVRWVYGAGCRPVIKEVVVPDGRLGPDYQGTFSALRSAGYDRRSRKYLAFADANELCGIATYYLDDRPTGNANDGNAGPTYARVDLNCWVTDNYSAAAHELTHMLGAVQPEAPRATRYGHCTDEFDLMCYNDGSGMAMQQVCGTGGNHLLDCRNDDYFHTRPRSGSYLDRHWNVASSSFLDVVAPLAGTGEVRVRLSRTTAQSGDPVTATALAPSGHTLRWTASKAACVEGGRRGTVLRLRCPATHTGVLRVRVRATADGQTTSATARLRVTEAAPPSVSLAAPAEAGTGSPFTLQAHPVGKAPFTYYWNLPAGCSATGRDTATPTVVCDTAGEHQAQVDVEAADGQVSLAPYTTVRVTADGPAEPAGPDQVTAAVRSTPGASAAKQRARLHADVSVPAAVTWRLQRRTAGCRLSAGSGARTRLVCRPTDTAYPVVLADVATEAGHRLRVAYPVRVSRPPARSRWTVRVTRRAAPIGLVGAVRDARTGRPVGDGTAVAEARWRGTRNWVRIATLRVGHRGRVVLRGQLRRAAHLRLRYLGTEDHAAATSPVRYYKVPTRFAALRTSDRGRVRVVHGRLLHGHGTPVRGARVRLQRRSPSGGWAGFRTVRSNRTGHLRVRVPAGPRVRWRYPGTAAKQPSRSRPLPTH